MTNFAFFIIFEFLLKYFFSDFWSLIFLSKLISEITLRENTIIQ